MGRHGQTRAQGKVSEVWVQEGYGWIEDAEGRRSRFERDDVEGRAFLRLVAGSPVSFERAEGQEEPRARRVKLEDR